MQRSSTQRDQPDTDCDSKHADFGRKRVAVNTGGGESQALQLKQADSEIERSQGGRKAR